MNLVEIINVRKDYFLGKTSIHALRGIYLKIENGEFLAIVAPSGAGKTTLLNLIGAIDSPTEGKVLFEGKDLSGMNDRQLTKLRLYKIGFIFQTFNLIPVLNVYENIEFPLLLRKDISPRERKKRTEKLIEEVGLGEFAHHKPAELSGGQRQRVAIARALVTGPDLVLADEPTANLDSETGNRIMETMKALNKIENTTFVFSTHDPEVIKYAKRIVKMRDGKIIEDSEA